MNCLSPKPEFPRAALPTAAVLTIENLRAEFGCARSTIYRMIGRGELAAFKLGRTTVFRREDVERLKQSLPVANIKRA